MQIVERRMGSSHSFSSPEPFQLVQDRAPHADCSYSPSCDFAHCVATADEPSGRASIILLASAAVVVIPTLLAGPLAAFDSAVDLTWGIRLVLWREAAELFEKNAVLGLGFGGWDDHLVSAASRLGLQRTLPPHNVLIAAWAEAGLITALLNVAVLIYLLWVIWGAVKAAPTIRYARTTMILAFAIVWPAAHSFADNTQVFGTMHTVMLFAAVVAYLEDQRSTRAGHPHSMASAGESGDKNRAPLPHR